METQRDSNVGVYFMAMIFIGLAIGGIIAENKTGGYWDRFCTEHADVEACQMLTENRQKAIGELIKLGDTNGSHGAIPGLPPAEESAVDVAPTEAAADDAEADASPTEATAAEAELDVAPAEAATDETEASVSPAEEN